MRLPRVLASLTALVLGAAVSVLADSRSDADLANERFPNPPGELEKHWKVDCTATRQALVQLAQTEDRPLAKDELQSLSQALNKCAMIYNVPGAASQHGCPRYDQALRALIAGRATPAALQQAGAALDCSPGAN